MYILLDTFHQGGKYCTQISSHQPDLIREGTFTDKKYFSISSLQTDYFNIDSSSGCGGNNERKNHVQKNAHFAEVQTILQNFLKYKKG